LSFLETVPPSPTSDKTSSRELPIMTPKRDVQSCHVGRKTSLLWLCLGLLGRNLWLLQQLPAPLLVDASSPPSSICTSSPSLTLPLAEKSAGAPWGQGGTSGKPSLDTMGLMKPCIKLSEALRYSPEPSTGLHDSA